MRYCWEKSKGEEVPRKKRKKRLSKLKPRGSAVRCLASERLVEMESVVSVQIQKKGGE
jgi:hypothetical protein